MKNSIIKMTLKTAVAAALVSIPSFTFASMTPLDCESDNGEMAACASIPADAPEAIPVSSDVGLRTTSQTPNKINLVDQETLSGGDVYSPASVGLIGSSRGLINPAMLAAVETEAQIRRIELFLKGGPAAAGDLRVVAARLPTAPQK